MLKDIRTGSAGSKKGMEILSWVLIAVIVVVIATILTKIFKAAKAGSTAAGNAAGGAIIEAQTGIIPTRQNVCRSVATDAENAITRIPMVGTIIWVTDDDLVIALNRLQTAPEAALTSEFFKQQSGGSLKSVVEGSFMVEASRKKINSIIRQNLV